ncbi:AAA family ATPase [Austwickia chelonae]|uniref:AAA family ATPase n=1 Tax=Austwickia chelonae TaxID=100225 RepID=UPI000E2265FE|nr:AAA family ATPase [Austwickia chelonae]
MLKLSLESVSKMYGKTLGVDAVDVEIRGGRVLGLLGPNGSKSWPRQCVSGRPWTVCWEQYSHGMRRKISLLGALLRSPEVLVLDEPLRGLDPESSSLITRLIQHQRAAGRIVILSTHDLLVAERYCDDLLILDHGRVVASGPVQQLVSAGETLEDSFLRITGLEESTRAASEALAGLLGLAPQELQLIADDAGRSEVVR